MILEKAVVAGQCPNCDHKSHENRRCSGTADEGKNDCACSWPDPYNYSTLEIVPLTLRAARIFVNAIHRHHKAPQGGLFAIGAARDGELVACVIVGKPVARMNDDGATAEVTRLAADGSKNACSLLYAAAWRTARGMGYRRLITYTLMTEPGTSLRAAGWKLIGQAGGGTWNRPNRERTDKHPTELKLRWEAV